MKSSRYGFVCEGISDENALQVNDIGRKITTTTTPWSVYDDVANIIINRWPVNLWFVEVLQAFSTSSKNYTPAITIKPLKQLPCSLLFGPQGEGVCDLLDKISQLTLLQIEALSELSNPLSDEAYAKAWNCWLKTATKFTMHYDADHTGILAVGVGEESSPIYNGFLSVEHLFRQRAKVLVGKAAFIGQQDMEEAILAPVWRRACTVLLQLAMGVGAERYVVPQDLPFLLMGQSVIG